MSNKFPTRTFKVSKKSAKSKERAITIAKNRNTKDFRGITVKESKNSYKVKLI